MSNPVIIEELGPNLVVRFDRREIRSPLSTQVLEELQRIVSAADNSSLARLIFTGTGNVFASGADLREIAGIDSEGATEFALRGQKLMRQISRLQATTIAAVNGICFGGALDLALACKHRIAAPAAVFSHPGANLGIITGWGGTQRLPRLIGQAKALEMFFTARQVTAVEAREIGLVDSVSTEPLEAALGQGTL